MQESKVVVVLTLREANLLEDVLDDESYRMQHKRKPGAGPGRKERLLNSVSQVVIEAAASPVKSQSRSPAVARKAPPIHPGELLKETLDDLGLSMNRLAQVLHVPANRISGIVAGQRGITGETALRLARYFNTTPDYWINMQAQYDLETARDEWEARIRSEVLPLHAA